MPVLFTILNKVTIYSEDVDISAIRSQGPGGQHVNKTSTAISLRFDIYNSALSSEQKEQILCYSDYRISAKGLISIKAQRYRSQKQNRADAIERLHNLLTQAVGLDIVIRPRLVIEITLDNAISSDNCLYQSRLIFYFE